MTADSTPRKRRSRKKLVWAIIIGIVLVAALAIAGSYAMWRWDRYVTLERPAEIPNADSLTDLPTGTPPRAIGEYLLVGSGTLDYENHEGDRIRLTTFGSDEWDTRMAGGEWFTMGDLVCPAEGNLIHRSGDLLDCSMAFNDAMLQASTFTTSAADDLEAVVAGFLAATADDAEWAGWGDVEPPNADRLPTLAGASSVLPDTITRFSDQIVKLPPGDEQPGLVWTETYQDVSFDAWPTRIGLFEDRSIWTFYSTAPTMVPYGDALCGEQVDITSAFAFTCVMAAKDGVVVADSMSMFLRIDDLAELVQSLADRAG